MRKNRNIIENNYEKYKVEQGREILVREKNSIPGSYNRESNRTWGGEWVRNQIEDNSDSKITLGFIDDPIRGPYEPAKITKDSLFNNMFVLGSSGYGRNVLMNQTLLQLVNQGHGIILADMYGNYAMELYEQISKERINDVRTINMRPNDWRTNLFDVGSENVGIAREYANNISMAFEGYFDKSWPKSKVIELITTMIKSNSDYTIIDLINSMRDKTEFNKITENFELDWRFDDIESSHQQIFNHMYKCLEEDKQLQVLADYETSESIGSIIESEKILILNTSGLFNTQSSELITKLIMAYVSAYKSIELNDPINSTPLFMGINNIDKIAGSHNLIENFFNKPYGVKLGVIGQCQHPNQLPEELHHIIDETTHKVIFNSGVDSQEAQRISNILSNDIDATQLRELKQYEALGRLMTEDRKLSKYIKMMALPYLPPKRKFKI